MGVDYYSCNCCDKIFSDAGHYVSCECGIRWCSDECAIEDGYMNEHCEKYNVEGWRNLSNIRKLYNCKHKYCDSCHHYKPASCKYCRGEDYTNIELLNKAMELLGMNREDLIGIVKKEMERKKKIMSEKEKVQESTEKLNKLIKLNKAFNEQILVALNTFYAWQIACKELIDVNNDLLNIDKVSD